MKRFSLTVVVLAFLAGTATGCKVDLSECNDHSHGMYHHESGKEGCPARPEWERRKERFRHQYEHGR